MIANRSALAVWWLFVRITNQNWHNRNLLATMDLALFDLAHNLDFFARSEGQFKKKTDRRRRNETLIRSEFDA